MPKVFFGLKFEVVMRFIDEMQIEVVSGDGGDGCVSFRREKYVPLGGPDGGNGGAGGDVILVADHNLHTLYDLKSKPKWAAKKGQNGKGKNQQGACGSSCEIKVPVGTMVYEEDTLICDLNEHQKSFLAAPGGRGGRGNASYKTSTNQAPKLAMPGKPGITKRLKLQLKMIADIGLIGMPNAGKSTFLAAVSKAKPKIADYPFTTLNPQLGVVAGPNFASFTIADIPGLIEDAHLGLGLGDRFLRHVERTKVFLHLVSLDPMEPQSALERYQMIRKELELYQPQFKDRTEIIALNKADLLDEEALAQCKKDFQGHDVHVISGVSGYGVIKLLSFLAKHVKK